MKQLDTKSTEERLILDFEKMGFQCIKVLGRYNYRQMKESLEMHKHEGMVEICFLEKGSQYYHIQGNDYHIKGGDILLTFPGEEHGTKGYPEEKGILFWLIISKPKNKQCLLNLTHKETEIIINRLMQLKQNRVFKGSLLLKCNLNKIFRIYNTAEDTIYKKIQLTNLLLNLLLNVLEYGEKSSDSSVSESMQQICRFINNNLNEELRLEMLSEKINLSLSHFKYRFKKEIGTTPTDYILRSKMEKAKSMLLLNQSIKDVAYDLAFSSSSYFATVFKRYTRLTPTQYLNLKRICENS